MNDTDWVAERKKSPACPKCGTNEHVVPVVYGLPAVWPPPEEQRNNSVLGGCCIEPDSPSHHCRKCGAAIGLLFGTDADDRDNGA